MIEVQVLVPSSGPAAPAPAHPEEHTPHSQLPTGASNRPHLRREAGSTQVSLRTHVLVHPIPLLPLLCSPRLNLLLWFHVHRAASQIWLNRLTGPITWTRGNTSQQPARCLICIDPHPSPMCTPTYFTKVRGSWEPSVQPQLSESNIPNPGAGPSNSRTRCSGLFSQHGPEARVIAQR